MNELATQDTSSAVSVGQMKQQMLLIQEYMSDILQEGQHYGKIPGCGDKPSLLKPGAEKLCFAFNLRPDFTIKVKELGDGHREVEVVCRLINKQTGFEVAQGVGSASTRESKWLYRSGVGELTEFDVPKAYWKDRSLNILQNVDESLTGLPLSTQKDEDGKWKIAIKGTKVEHDNPADYYNTVLKMSKKRAQVDATITGTACSDIFTQDIEEIRQNEQASQGKAVDPDPKDEGVQEDKKSQSPDDKITPEQLVRLDKARSKAGWSPEDVQEELKSRYKVSAGRDLTVAQCNDFLKRLEPDDIP